MMITAHGAAAVLSAVGYAKIKNKEILDSFENSRNMFWLGILPDIPLSILVLSGNFDPSIHYHHTWITHTPFFWLIISLLTMKIISRKTGIALLSATWLHLAMDWYGGADGIPFLYPFTNKQFGAWLHGVNGAGGMPIYFSNPFLVVLEVSVQGTFLLLLILWLFKKLAKRQ